MAGRKLSNSSNAVYRRAYYARNRKEQIERAKDWQGRVRIEIQKLFLEFRACGCVLCGEMHPSCLEAHHRDPAQKEHRIWEWRHRGLAPEKVRVELEKCVCVCSNCHRKIHSGVDHVDRAPQINYKERWLVKKQKLLNAEHS